MTIPVYDISYAVCALENYKLMLYMATIIYLWH